MTCAFARHPTTTLVASGGLDNLCSVYKIDQNRDAQGPPTPRELGGHSGYISCCRFLNDKQILTSSGDMSCILWDIESTKALSTFKSHHGDVMLYSLLLFSAFFLRFMNYSLTFSISLHGDTFVSGGCDKTARLWDIRQPQCTQIFSGHTNDINSVE